MASLSSAQSKPKTWQVDDIQAEHPDQLSDRYLPGNNPFLATTPSERDINFPPFDQAFLIDSEIVNSSSNSVSGQSSSVAGRTNVSAGDSSNNAHLSISARAALAEHNRHIARFGIDNSFVEDDHEVAFPQFVDPLDAEWERLLLNTTSSDVNLSHISTNHSVLSAAAHPTNHEEHIVIAASRSPNGADIDAIEAITDVSCSEFLNTSRAIDILRTPEHVRSRENGVLPKAYDVAVRGEHMPSSVNPWDSSEGSFSDNSTHILQKMYLNSMRSHLAQPSESMSSKSPSSRARAEEQESFSLYNVDISRISADDDEESITAKNLDHSFTTSGNIFPDPMNNFFSSHSETNTQTPSISNSTSRKTVRHHHHPLSDSNILTPKRDIRWRNSPSAHSTHENRQVSSSASILERCYVRNQEEADDDRTIESKLATMALSPISKQAAEKAISILQSSPDWNVAFSPTRNSDFTTSTSSYRDAKRPQQLMRDDLFLYPNIFNSRSDDEETSPGVIVEFKSGSDDHKNDVNDDSKDQFFDLDDGTSPLHSSSEEKKKVGGRANNQSIPTPEAVGTSGILENSGSSEDHLKKNSLSSISPNSSTEHHISTKPTANSSSSLSASTKNSVKQEKSVHNTVQQTWDGFTDRRRYRTVVPIRVFISEPNLFPDEEDSFSNQPKQMSLSLPAYIGSSSKRVGFNHDQIERSIRSSPR
jgi:hypothetical protein